MFSLYEIAYSVGPVVFVSSDERYLVAKWSSVQYRIYEAVGVPARYRQVRTVHYAGTRDMREAYIGDRILSEYLTQADEEGEA